MKDQGLRIFTNYGTIVGIEGSSSISEHGTNAEHHGGGQLPKTVLVTLEIDAESQGGFEISRGTRVTESLTKARGTDGRHMPNVIKGPINNGVKDIYLAEHTMWETDLVGNLIYG
jgi:hypothetical protein